MSGGGRSGKRTVGWWQTRHGTQKRPRLGAKENRAYLVSGRQVTTGNVRVQTVVVLNALEPEATGSGAEGRGVEGRCMGEPSLRANATESETLGERGSPPHRPAHSSRGRPAHVCTQVFKINRRSSTRYRPQGPGQDRGGGAWGTSAGTQALRSFRHLSPTCMLLTPSKCVRKGSVMLA